MMLSSQTIDWTAGRDSITIAVKIADALTMFENSVLACKFPEKC
jgi:hypothetical protein